MRCCMLGMLAGLLWGLAAEAGPAPSVSRREGDLKVGDAAPDFSIKDAEGKKTVTLAELRGKPVVLIFGSCT